jgi:predicted negative regulator of RcsB-dependent stress response
VPNSDPARDLERLMEQRDLAAYRAIAAIEIAVHFWEAQDYAAAFLQLQRAQNDFQEAERRITEFYKSLLGEIKRHGHRPAA